MNEADHRSLKMEGYEPRVGDMGVALVSGNLRSKDGTDYVLCQWEGEYWKDADLDLPIANAKGERIEAVWPLAKSRNVLRDGRG